MSIGIKQTPKQDVKSNNTEQDDKPVAVSPPGNPGNASGLRPKFYAISYVNSSEFIIQTSINWTISLDFLIICVQFLM